ncbi:hypothetical protein BJ508DRAFT_381477 [Ascobolus immersus RN42]|uniref:Uncharacterized protein n=1 Tax=Ascobolus immersus RN42 TaxID=1160509 RepID=A0A3N4HEC6_ASCIM|nr:hypothetical protein BJ508DRAFT_381477 [Ascobolus immersus RN42]
MAPFPELFTDISERAEIHGVNPQIILLFLVLIGAGPLRQALSLSQLSKDQSAAIFSFGWIPVIIYSLAGIPISDGHHQGEIINVSSGIRRTNKSAILTRLLRDYPSWMTSTARDKVQQLLEDKAEDNIKKRSEKQVANEEDFIYEEYEDTEPITQAGLCVTIYNASTAALSTGIPKSTYATTIIQLAVAALLSPKWGNATFFITVVGIALSFISAYLLTPTVSPRRKRKQPESFILTDGNGSQHAILVRVGRDGINLEDLASAVPKEACKLKITALGVAWLGLCAATLYFACWSIAAIGVIGLLQSLHTAGARKAPEDLGLGKLTLSRVIGEIKVGTTLEELSQTHPKTATSLHSLFFPGQLAPFSLKEQTDSTSAEVPVDTESGIQPDLLLNLKDTEEETSPQQEIQSDVSKLHEEFTSDAPESQAETILPPPESPVPEPEPEAVQAESPELPTYEEAEPASPEPPAQEEIPFSSPEPPVQEEVPFEAPEDPVEPKEPQPESPVVPAEEEVPPASPELPVEEEVPSAPASPELPVEEEVPSAPASPEVPVEEEVPSAPASPELPVEEEVPSAPPSPELPAEEEAQPGSPTPEEVGEPESPDAPEQDDAGSPPDSPKAPEQDDNETPPDSPKLPEQDDDTPTEDPVDSPKLDQDAEQDPSDLSPKDE